MSVRVECGALHFSGLFAGRSVGEVRDNDTLRGLLSIQEGMSSEVSSDGGNNWSPVNDAYVLNENETVRFTRPAAAKG